MEPENKANLPPQDNETEVAPDTGPEKMPDADDFDNIGDFHESLEKFVDAGGTIPGEDDDDIPAASSEAEATPAEDEEHTEADAPTEKPTTAPQEPATPQDQRTTPEPLAESDLSLDDLLTRYPKPEGCDPRNPSNDSEAAAHRYWHTCVRVQGAKHKRAMDDLKASYGDAKPEEVASLKRNWDILDKSPDLAGARILIAGESKDIPFATALLDPNHPSHHEAQRRAYGSPGEQDTHDEAFQERLEEALTTPDGQIDPNAVHSLRQAAYEAGIKAAAQAAPQPATQDPWTMWANERGVPMSEMDEYAIAFQRRGSPEFATKQQFDQFCDSLRTQIDAERKTDFERMRVKDLETQVSATEPRRRSSSPGRVPAFNFEGQDAAGIAKAIEEGKIDLNDPEIREISGLA